MASLWAAYKNELFKISKKKKLLVAAILAVSAILLGGLLVLGINSLAGIRLAGGTSFAVRALPFFLYTLIPLFTAFICIDMYCGEFSNDTIKTTLMRPVSRSKVYLAKVLAAATFLLFNLLFTFLAASVVSFLTGGAGFGILDALTSYLMSFFPLMVFALLVILVANFSRGSASAFLIAVVLFLALKGCEFAFPAYKSFFFTSAFDWYKLFIGTYFNAAKVLRLFLVLAGYGMVFYSAGLYLFEKRAI